MTVEVFDYCHITEPIERNCTTSLILRRLEHRTHKFSTYTPTGMPNKGLLYALHERFKFRNLFDIGAICKAISVIPPAVIPPIHIAVLYHFWRAYHYKVDKKRCECSCWDTVFKGPYETHIGSFKHLYFNATVNTFKIWITTVISIIVFYETVKYLIRLRLKNQLRYSMLSLFISSTFSHYYTWWNYINYWNDEFYKQWNHQLYFTVTELFSTYLVLRLADKQQTFTRKKALFILGISLIHIVAGCVDQFIYNVLRFSGRPHQVVRDLAFMFGDALHMIVSLVYLYKSWNTRRIGLLKDLLLTATAVLLGLLVYAHL